MQNSPVTRSIVDASYNGILAGYLRACKANEEPSADLAVRRDEEVFIGRDASKCQLIVQDPTVSNNHCRVYSIVVDDNIEPLIYIEDMSSNGTLWNGSFLGRGNEGVLLCNGDKIRISPRISYTFESIRTSEPEPLDDIQESEIRLMRHFYKVTKRKLGAGAYGDVYLAVCLAQQQQLACKIVNLRKLRLKEENAERERTKRAGRLHDIVPRKSIVDQRVDRAFREVEILKDLDHPNIIRLQRVFKSANNLFIFEELLTGGDLFSYIESKGGHGLLELDAAIIVRQIVEALKYLHENDVVHRDIKPDNILMTCSRNPPRVVLTDFGHAIKIAGSSSRIQRMLTTVGTLDYVAPEVHGINKTVSEQGYTKAVDMWSLGIVTSAVLTGRSIFVKTQVSCQRRSSATAIIEAAAMCNLQELDNSVDWARVSDQGKDLVKKLLVLDERERMTAVQALQHGWFTSKERENDSDALYQHAIKTWKPRYRAPIDLFADLDIYANAQKPFMKVRKRWFWDPVGRTYEKSQCSLPSKRKRAAKPIEPHYQPPHQHLYQLMCPRRQHTTLPSIAKTNIEPPNIEKLQISEYPQEPTDVTSVDTIIPASRSVLMVNAVRADSQKPLDEEPPEEIGIVNQGLKSKLVRPTLSSNRRRSKSRGGPSAMSTSRKSSRRFIFDIEEDRPDPLTVNNTTHMPSTPRFAPFTPINQKRKPTPVLEEYEGSVDAEERHFRNDPLIGPLVSKKRVRWSLVKTAQPGAPDRTENVSSYWSSSGKAAGNNVTVPQDSSAQTRIQQSTKQDSTLIILPPGFPEFYPVYTPQANGNEDSSDLQKIPLSADSSKQPMTRKDRRRSSFVDSVQVELHERAARQTRGFRTAKAYGQDVEEMWGTLEAERRKEERRAVSGDLTDSIRTAY